MKELPLAVFKVRFLAVAEVRIDAGRGRLHAPCARAGELLKPSESIAEILGEH